MGDKWSLGAKLALLLVVLNFTGLLHARQEAHLLEPCQQLRTEGQVQRLMSFMQGHY